MTKEQIQMVLGGIGLILIAITFIKMSIIGYYPSEALFFVGMGVVGMIFCYIASKIKTEDE